MSDSRNGFMLALGAEACFGFVGLVMYDFYQQTGQPPTLASACELVVAIFVLGVGIVAVICGLVAPKNRE